MNKYELTLVTDGKAGAAKKKKAVDAFEKTLGLLKGKVTSAKDWGTKDLAYKIGKNETGVFSHFELELDPSAVKALNDKLRTDNDLVRFLLIRKDE